MKELDLINNELTELSEEDLKALCQLNNIDLEELKYLELGNNDLKNINFIQPNTPFINLKILSLSYNQITDISNIKYLTNLEKIGINKLKLNNEKETIELLKTMKSIEKIFCVNTFKNYTEERLRKELPNVKIYCI